MDKKIGIAMAALMVAALVAPAVMAQENVGYSASVSGTATVAVTITDNTFGDVPAGTTASITPSLNLNNTGNAAADVNARFTTNVSGLYGLVNASNVIGGTNFSIGRNGTTLVPLNDDNTNPPLGPLNRVPASTAIDYNAALFVPVGTLLGSYSGNVQLTFTNV